RASCPCPRYSKAASEFLCGSAAKIACRARPPESPHALEDSRAPSALLEYDVRDFAVCNAKHPQIAAQCMQIRHKGANQQTLVRRNQLVALQRSRHEPAFPLPVLCFAAIPAQRALPGKKHQKIERVGFRARNEEFPDPPTFRREVAARRKQ